MMLTARIANCSPRQGRQADQITPTPKRLSCTSCRQRKIKCDKADPCGPCLKSGIKCIFPTRRTRAPRGGLEPLEARDAELLRRIKRLEEMLANKVDRGPALPDGGTAGSNPNPTLITPLLSSGVGGGIQTDVTVDDHYASFVKQQSSSSRHLNSEFWSSLSNEFDGLRQLIEEPLVEEDDFDEPTSPSIEAADSSAKFILQDPDIFVDSKEIVHPSDADRAILFQFYFTNVDPVCKILHRPTVNTYFSNLERLLDPITGRFKFRSLEAVTVAAYFAAVTTMSPQECLTCLGEQKNILSARYKRCTEVALVQADFLNTLEIATLQALTIYIVAQRSLNQSRFSWTLIGLAVRVAHGLGLHRDGDGRAFSAFEAEMRRRVWWQILALDMRACEDRGSESVLAENSFNTVMPCNLNDDDFSYDTQHPLYGRIGPTEMTLCLLSMDALCTSRKIDSRSPTADPRDLTLQGREQIVKEYSQRVESTYMANCEISDQRTGLLRLMSHYWICKLLLNLYYPLQHRMPLHQVQSRSQGLQAAVAFLNINELIEQHPSSASFEWLFKTYVPWHAVAVTLAELCAQPHNPLAERAWEIIESRFKDWNGRVADIKEVMLWGPIKSLLTRAQVARRHDEELSGAEQGLQLPDLELTLQDFDASGTSNPEIGVGKGSSSRDPHSFDTFHLFDQDQLLDFVSFAQLNTEEGALESPGASNNLENWNEFLFDVGALVGEFPSEPYGI